MLQETESTLLSPAPRWVASRPLLAGLDRDGEHFYSLKDPSVVRHQDRWHIFATVRGHQRSHQIEYLSLEDWARPEIAQRHLLPITPGYFCAPAVFYFRPHRKWYLLYQDTGGSMRDEPRRPAFSTNEDVANWQNWSAPQPLYAEAGEKIKNWIDFWIICDESRAHLFFTCDDGTMWRAQAALQDFPHGWSHPTLALQGDIFEASHTYRVRGEQGERKYLTIMECVGQTGRRYYKSFVAPALDARWQPLAATWEHPFAGLANVIQQPRWSDSFSHGELLRAGVDQRMEVDPREPALLFQGVSDADRDGKPYGEIPWRLGLLMPTR